MDSLLKDMIFFFANAPGSRCPNVQALTAWTCVLAVSHLSTNDPYWLLKPMGCYSQDTSGSQRQPSRSTAGGKCPIVFLLFWSSIGLWTRILPITLWGWLDMNLIHPSKEQPMWIHNSLLLKSDPDSRTGKTNKQKLSNNCLFPILHPLNPSTKPRKSLKPQDLGKEGMEELQKALSDCT